MDFPTKWSINDGKMCQNFCEWDLFLTIQILGMHYGTLKMRKVLPFCVSSFHPIFWLKSLPQGIYRWEKVKKVNPILALCIYGPLGKQVNLAQFVTILEPVSPFFGPIGVWIAPNLVKWDRVLPYCTSGGLWGPFWAISGHLGLISGPRARGWVLFGVYFSPIWLPKMT